MRKSLSLLLIIVAAVLTLPASIAAWEDRVLLNEDRFVELGNDVLSKDAVQQHLATEIANDISMTPGLGLLKDANTLLGNSLGLDVANILGSVLGGTLGVPAQTQQPRPGAAAPANPIRDGIIRPVALDVVRTLPNTPVSDQALRATHGLLVTSIRSDLVKPEDQRVVLDLGGGVSELISELGVGASATGDAGRIVLVQGADLSGSFRMARLFDGRAVIFLVLPLAALAVGLALAPERGRFATYAGIALLVASGLWILLVKLPLKDNLVERAMHNESAKAAVSATYDVVSTSFVQQQFYLIGVAVVLVIAGLVMSSATGRSRTEVRADVWVP